MPLQSSGIIVVDKTSVITAVPATVAAGGPGRPNGVLGNIGVSNSSGNSSIESASGILHHPTVHDWQGGENDCSNFHATNSSHNLIRRNQRSISSNSVSGGSSSIHHQNQAKTATITTIPLTNGSQFNTNQMNHMNHHQQQQIHHQQVQQQQSRQHHQAATTVLQAAQSGQVIVSEEFLEHATFGSNHNTTGSANVINLTTNELVSPTQIIKLVSDANGGNVLIDPLGNLTVLAKQHSPSSGQQTFNFLNTKGGLSYVATAKSSSPQPQSVAQQQIHHIAPAGTNVQNGSGGPTTPTMVQKMGVPRNVQVVTRVQTITPSSSQSQHQSQQAQQLLAQNVHNNQVIVQQKYVHNIVSTSGTINTKLSNNIGGMLKKQTASIGKLTQQKTAIGSGIKSHLHQSQAQQQQQQQVMQHHAHQQHIQTIGIGQQSTSATIKAVRPQKVVKKIIGNVGKGSTINSANTKYIMQSPLVLSNATNNQLMNTKMQSGNATSGNIVVPQQVIGTINNSGCPTSGGGAIKFVNAHGTVLQSHQSQPTIQSTVQHQTHVPQANQKVRNQLRVHQQNNQNQQSLQHFTQATTAVVTNEGILIPAYVNSAQTPTNGEEIMINGTQMTEELSARILQSLSQKSIQYNMRQHQQPQQQLIQQQTVTQQAPAGIVFESSGAGLSAREYAICKPAIGHQAQAQPTPGGLQQQKIISPSNVVFEPPSREYGVCKTTTIQQHISQQQHPAKIIQQSMSMSQPTPSSASTNVVCDPSLSTRIYPVRKSAIFVHHQKHHQHILQPNLQQQHHILQPQNRFQQQQIHQHSSLQQQLPPQRRTQSLDRKHGLGGGGGGSQASKRSTDYFKVNTNEIQSSYSSSTTFIDNIPLPSPIQRGDNAPAAQQAEHEDDIIGEEVRPIPVNTLDARVQMLHAVLQDHTYVAAMPVGLPLELYQQEHNQQIQQQQQQNMINIPQQQQQQQQQHSNQQQSPVQQQSSIHIGGGSEGNSAPKITSISSNGVYNSGCIVDQQNQIASGSSATMQLTTTAGSLLTSSNLAGYPYNQIAQHNQRDDDANSVISNESRHGRDGLDNDLGEETETAPEAEAEDDSVTRCICDLTHDDGYMICCDKCSAWQHVDCMGIDRQNIPDEYLCEVCQPRQVDRARAKTLQLLKRKEQTQLLLSGQMGAVTASNNMLTDSSVQFMPGGCIGQDRLQPLMVNTGGSGGASSIAVGKKGKLVGSKKKELLKRVKKERSNSKRRETRRTTKRKTKNVINNDANCTEKHAQSLRQYIENYELAVTNHYSPELRARLIAIGKQMPSFTEQRVSRSMSAEDKCTTVPHAGGKILISNLDIQPNSPIIELRGKYMLATQYKNQNPSINMNLQPPNGLQKNPKTPGPFIFFHKLSNDPSVPEICVDTRTYGNEARFVRRSCRPNAEVQHSFEKGTIHLWVVSLTNIKASTEITIRHEPHDLVALDNKQYTLVITPTSTMCACGLTKDCPFASCAPVAAPVLKSNNKKVVINGGCLADVSKVQSQTGQAHPGGGIAKKSVQSSSVSRGRSTSSSGESNAGLLSPNSNFTNTYSLASVSMMHDSGVYTSSSSPSVSIPSPTHAQTINSPPQHINSTVSKISVLPQAEQIESTTITTASVTASVMNVALPAKSPQKCNTQSRKTPVKHPRNSSISEDSSSQNASSALAAPTQPASEEKRESRKLTREERKMEAIVRAIEKMEKNQQRKQELKQARNTSTGSVKRRNSSSPSPKRIKSQTMCDNLDVVADASQPIQTAQQQHVQQSIRKSSSGGTLPRKKKRKSSKSYQIQTNQRKRRRSRMNSNDSDMVTSEESSSLLSPPLARTISLPACLPSPEEIAERQKCLVASLSLDSAQTQCIQMSQQQSHMHRRDELPLPPLQPLQQMLPLQKVPPPLQPIQQSLQNQSLQQQIENEPQNVNSNQAAGLLLAFATNTEPDETSATMEANSCISPIGLPPHQAVEQQRAAQTPPMVSSTCMLVEAAVGPLESLEMLTGGGAGGANEFKLPVKTKTKKTIMNDWLNQASEYQGYQQTCGNMEEEQRHPVEVYQQSSPSLHHVLQQQQILLQAEPESPQTLGQGIETLVQAAESICEYKPKQCSSPSFLASPSADEPQNLSMVAKKVEEFIHQSDANFVCTEEIKCETIPMEISPNLLLPIHAASNNSNCSGNSSVKKRWLRQAISEECSDDVAANLSASSPTQMCPTPNGFMTPLKKRRVIRECSEMELASNSPEDLSMSKSFSELSQVTREISATMATIDADEVTLDSKLKVKQEICDADDEVDIINSPPPDEKMITSDDTLVKIEPEDVSTEIKVDVEKEECSNDIGRRIELAEQVPIDDVKDIKLESSTDTTNSLYQNEVDIKISPASIKIEENQQKSDIPLLSSKIDSIIKDETPPSTRAVKSEPVENKKCENVSDEIADIQKRLHSFHTENIMILQSRNKSKIARSLKMEPAGKVEKIKTTKSSEVKTEVTLSTPMPLMGSEENLKGKRKNEKLKSMLEDEGKHKKDGKKEGKHKNSRKKKHVDDIKRADEPKTKSGKKKISQVKTIVAAKEEETAKMLASESKQAIDIRETKDSREKNEVEQEKSEPPALIPTIVSTVTPIKEELKIDEKHLQAALTIPNFNRTVPTVTSIANYVSSNGEQSYDITTLLAAPPPPPPPFPVTDVTTINAGKVTTSSMLPQCSTKPPPLHLPYYYNTIYGKPNSVATLSGSLSSLSTSPNLLLSEYMDSAKTKSYSSLGGYISPFGLGLNKSPNAVSTPSVTPPITVTTTTSSDTTTSLSSLSSSSGNASSKILTKTASHDPRLNPILTAPEPPPAPPRRKLSISEYRKRKQLSSESISSASGNGNGLEKILNANTNSQGSTSSSGNSGLDNCEKYDSGSNSNDESYSEKMVDVTKVQFSPAPTLLEQQQEIICERLKSLKNKALMGSTLSSASSGLSCLKNENTLSSSILLSCSTPSSSVADVGTTVASSPSTEVNCFSLSMLESRNDEFTLARRTLRNNSTSSLESISSTSSSRSSSYRASTPVPKQYDGMDSPRYGKDEHNDVANSTNHNNIENLEMEAAATTTTPKTTLDATVTTVVNATSLPISSSSVPFTLKKPVGGSEIMNHSESSNESK